MQYLRALRYRNIIVYNLVGIIYTLTVAEQMSEVRTIVWSISQDWTPKTNMKTGQLRSSRWILEYPEPQIIVHQIIGSRSQNRRAHLYGLAIETLHVPSHNTLTPRVQPGRNCISVKLALARMKPNFQAQAQAQARNPEFELRSPSANSPNIISSYSMSVIYV